MLSIVRLSLGLVVLLTLGCGSAPPSTAQPVSLPDQGVEVPHYDVADLERLVLRELNRVRRAHGYASLLPDTSLAAIARGHSRAMLERGFFSHHDPEGRRADDRARSAGYRFHRFGENLFRGHLYDTITTTRHGDEVRTSYYWYTPEDLAALIVESWIESPGHRENMLSPAYDFGGIGIATGPEFDVLVTLNLSAR